MVMTMTNTRIRLIILAPVFAIFREYEKKMEKLQGEALVCVNDSGKGSARSIYIYIGVKWIGASKVWSTKPHLQWRNY